MKSASQQLTRFWGDTQAIVATTELVALATVAMIGLMVSFATVRSAVIAELADVGGAVEDLNQTFQHQSINSRRASNAGGGFLDATDAFDAPDDNTGQADQCVVFDVLPTDEQSVAGNTLQNFGFETGVDPFNARRTFGRQPTPRVYLFNQADVPGWQTTAPDGLIEVWESGFNGVISQTGDFHAEINATTSAQLFQEFSVSPNDDIQYSVWHRGRAGVDIANVLIGSPGSQTVQQTLVTGPGAWVNYTGSYTVPAGVSSVRFGLESVGGGSVGNFIDNLEVFISP